MSLFFSMIPTSRLTVRPPPPISLSLMTSWRLENWPWISINEMRGLGSGQWICFIKSRRVMVSRLLLIFAIPCIPRLNSLFVSLREISQFSKCLIHTFRVEKRNTHAQVLAVGQTLSLKKFFPNFLGVQQNFNVSNGKPVYCFRKEFIFWDRINISSFMKPFVSKRKFRCEDTFYPQTLFTYCIQIRNHWTDM